MKVFSLCIALAFAKVAFQEVERGVVKNSESARFTYTTPVEVTEQRGTTTLRFYETVLSDANGVYMPEHFTGRQSAASAEATASSTKRSELIAAERSKTNDLKAAALNLPVLQVCADGCKR
jgi:hypothetical protein